MLQQCAVAAGFWGNVELLQKLRQSRRDLNRVRRILRATYPR